MYVKTSLNNILSITMYFKTALKIILRIPSINSFWKFSFRDRDDDIDNMESSFAEIQREEAKRWVGCIFVDIWK